MQNDITAICDQIIFEFIDGFSNQTLKQFADKTEWGFEIVRHKESLEFPRWVRVLSIGPDVSDNIKVGMLVLVEPLKWTNEYKVNGNRYWNTTEKHVLAVNDEGVE